MNKKDLKTVIIEPKEIAGLQYAEDVNIIYMTKDLDQLKDVNIDDCNFNFELQLGGSERNFVNVNCSYIDSSTAFNEIKTVTVAFYSVEKVMDDGFETTLKIIKELALVEQGRLNS